MTKLLILRHAETPLNKDRSIIGGRNLDTPLTFEGKIKSTQAGEALGELGVEPSAAVVTTALRTQETMGGILNGMGLILEPAVSEALLEMSLGEYEGRNRAEVYTPELVSEIMCDPYNFKLPGAESMNEVGDRVSNEFNIIAQNHPDETVLIVMHGLALTCALGRDLKWDYEKIRASVPNLSLSSVHIQDGVREIEYVGRDILGGAV